MNMPKIVIVKGGRDKGALHYAAKVTADYIEQLIKIADRYSLDRTDFVRKIMRKNFLTSMEINLDYYQFKKKEE